MEPNTTSLVNGTAHFQYPANVKQASGAIDGIDTDVTTYSFTDKIMIAIVQGGRLAQWVSLYDPIHRKRSLN